MEQKELVRNGENGTVDTYTIVLVMQLNDSDNLIKESVAFKDIVNDWYRVRAHTAEKVHLAAVSDPRYHKAIRELFEALHAMEVSLRPVFEKIPFLLAIHDQSGALVQEFELQPRI